MDIKLNYTQAGAGSPLILLHGNGESKEYFENQITPFSKIRSVIALDTRGHGGSPRGGGEFSIRRFAEDLKEFMDELGIERADILGFSDGGNIALTFALKYPGRVNRLVLNGANLNPVGVKRRVQIPIEIGYKIASLFAGRSDEAGKNAEMLGLMVNEPHILPEQLSNLDMPVLVIAGDRDMIKTSHTRLIAESISGAELVILHGDHFIANKCPDAFNAAVLDFLNR